MLGSYRVMHVVEEKERGRPNRRGLERSLIRTTEISKSPGNARVQAGKLQGTGECQRNQGKSVRGTLARHGLSGEE
jgi:hypothetical protein